MPRINYESKNSQNSKKEKESETIKMSLFKRKKRRAKRDQKPINPKKAKKYAVYLDQGKIIKTEYQNLNLKKGDILYLRRCKIRRNKKGIMFVTQDKNGNTVFLEDLEPNSGWKHIESEHGNQLMEHYEVDNIKKVPNKLKNNVRYGHENPKYSKGNARAYISEGGIVRVATRPNGYIITAYPYNPKRKKKKKK